MTRIVPFPLALIVTVLTTHPAGADPVGAALFQQNCARCHGAEGAGGDAAEPDIRGAGVTALSRAFGGLNRMPSFAFSESQVRALAEYLSTVAD
ncbi:hypothetical protein ACMU_18200 [Actibacterium mucosum KCTC 23349]|uniref:Cytochrome c domain-containing protein n=1 Tax=Actibacterium mucosum KCTC 23349 TaxID=1454373 RepID=A0A037ZHU3_9RHOB|nr:cytochrome c [Actibacterium mucosum]KAJ54360.1 hypothetical protein ACMU_18200 [Actibacterium mucosum KCTC 23349]